MPFSWNGKRADHIVRLGGIALILLAALCIRVLVGGGHVVGQPTPLEILVGAGAFVGMSSGACLTVLGRHLFDQVEISRPWSSPPRVTNFQSDRLAQRSDQVIRTGEN